MPKDKMHGTDDVNDMQESNITEQVQAHNI